MSAGGPLDLGIGVGLESDGACDVAHLEGTVTPQASQPEQNPTGTMRLAEHTTFRIGGPARRFVVAHTEAELCDAVRTADRAGEPLLVLSGGSNLLVGDQGFEGTVVQVATRGYQADVSSCGGATVKVAAGEVWDDLVAHAIEQEWIGVEALSGIPGLVGSTPVQNVGAYGAEVAQTIAQVRTLDRQTGQFRTFALADCGFGYRTSLFKQTRMPDGGPTGRYVVLDVTFQFELGTLSAPIAYPELARSLGVELGARVATQQVREAVLALRASKGMVLDPEDPDTWGAGSFFTNPILEADQAEQLPPEAPRFPTTDGRVKTSAAWLIDRAGFAKGHGDGPARLSSKHTLALTNQGGASSADVVALASEVATGVRHRFGVQLVPEPVLVGCSLAGDDPAAAAGPA